MGVVQNAGDGALITVNYSSNAAGSDPAEAAAWVKYANVTKGYGVTAPQGLKSHGFPIFAESMILSSGGFYGLSPMPCGPRAIAYIHSCERSSAFHGFYRYNAVPGGF